MKKRMFVILGFLRSCAGPLLPGGTNKTLLLKLKNRETPLIYKAFLTKLVRFFSNTSHISRNTVTITIGKDHLPHLHHLLLNYGDRHREV
jgi:hypothetical protein